MPMIDRAVRLTPAFAMAAMILFAELGCTPEPADENGRTDASVNAPAASAQIQRAEPEEVRAVVAETLAYAEVDARLVKGHFVFPQDMVEPLPAVILIHEWWGLDDSMRGLADRLASEGFIVLAVDLYNGKTAARAPDARKLMLEVVENPQFAEQNIKKAFTWVHETTGATEVAVVGYGYGGGWSLHAAMAIPDQLDAAVIFYGQVSSNEEALRSIEVPVLGFFGETDTAVPAEAVVEFEKTLHALRKDYDIEVFPGARGGFASPGNRNFDADLEAEAWTKMTTFLRENLVPEEEDS